MYSVFEGLMHEKGLKIADVSRETKIPYSCFTDWKAGRYKPKADKMKRIADYFGTSVKFLETGEDSEKESTSGKKYYFSDSTAEAAQDIFENPDLKILFDAARDSSPSDLRLAADLLKRLKGVENNE